MLLISLSEVCQCHMNKPRLACWVWKVTWLGHLYCSGQLASQPEMWVRLFEPTIRQTTHQLNTWVWISSKIIRACPRSAEPLRGHGLLGNNKYCFKPLNLGIAYYSRWDGWMASLIQWMRTWASSGNWWGTRKPGMLQSMGSQKVRHDLVTEQQYYSKIITRIKERIQRAWQLLRN